LIYSVIFIFIFKSLKSALEKLKPVFYYHFSFDEAKKSRIVYGPKNAIANDLSKQFSKPSWNIVISNILNQIIGFELQPETDQLALVLKKTVDNLK
jgi:hypothetical protein